jgi:chromosome segregation protein
VILKKIEMIGFKSFADKIEIGFEGGVTAIVGPNGCGKSNVCDAIKWVLGEQSSKALRGTNMQDVIFKGTEERKPQSYCEVSLVFDNEPRKVARGETAERDKYARIFPIDYNEVVLSRKLFRDGESEYAINRQPSRLKDIAFILHDTGIDRDGMTVIGQGQVTDLVNTKPENRRSIFEEAAGISKFRARKDEAERKLERTGAELIRVADVIGEIERNLGPLLRQAQNAEKYLAFKEQLRKHEINLFVYKYDTAEATKNKLQKETDEYSAIYEKLKSELEISDKESSDGMNKLTEYEIKASILRDKILKLSVNTERQTGERLLYVSLTEGIKQIELRKNELLSKRQMIKNIIDSGEGFKYSVKKLIEERTKNNEVARAVVGIVSQELSVPKNLETAVEIALGASAQNIITKNEDGAKKLISVLSSKNLGRATFLPITSVKPRSITQQERSILKGMGSRVIGVASELVKYKPEIAGIISNLLGRTIITNNLDSAIALSRSANYAFKAVTLDGDVIEPRGSITGGSKNAITGILWQTNNLEQIEAELKECDEKLKEAQNKANEIVKDMDSPMGELKDGAELENAKKELASIDNLREELNKKTSGNIAKRSELTERINEVQIKYYYSANLLSRVDIEIENLQQRINDEYQMNYSSCYLEKDENFDINTAVTEIDELKRQISRLGNVNIDAIEQSKTDKERYESYNLQCEDLKAAKADLEKVIKELDTQMETDFITAFHQINKNFGEVFQELFGGGNARLVLTDANDFLNSGIEIIAEPPGKKLQNLTLLSGGEKSLTAIAILFAILRLRPMPFCLLDEIEAALDDTNVVRFANYLHNFSSETQFIVITHRKPTMELADTLYGVTMEQKGISKIVSVKLEQYKSTIGTT